MKKTTKMQDETKMDAQQQQQPNANKQEEGPHPPIIASGGLPALIQSAQATDSEVRHQALLTLTNVAAHCDDCRGQVREAGVLQMLADLLDSPYCQENNARTTVTRCLVNVLRNGIDKDFDRAIVKRLLAALHTTISTFSSYEILIVSEAVRSVALIIKDAEINDFDTFGDRLDLLLAKPELINRIVALLKSNSIEVLASTLHFLTYIFPLELGDEYSTAMLRFVPFEDVLALTNSDDPRIWHQSLLILLNAADSNKGLTWMFSVGGMMGSLFRLSDHPNAEKREEACKVLLAVMNNSPQELYERLLSRGMPQAIMQHLDDNMNRPVDRSSLKNIDWTLTVLRQALERQESRNYTVAMFRSKGFIDRLTKIVRRRVDWPQSSIEHDQNRNSSEAAAILRDYFGVHDGGKGRSG